MSHLCATRLCGSESARGVLTQFFRGIVCQFTLAVARLELLEVPVKSFLFVGIV